MHKQNGHNLIRKSKFLKRDGASEVAHELRESFRATRPKILEEWLTTKALLRPHGLTNT